MTTMFPVDEKCAVCGAVQEFMAIGSTNAFGSPDLDLRPPQMQRGTMPQWIQECPVCGYVSGSISDKKGKVTKKWLASEEYRNCDGIEFRSFLAERFYKFYKISLLNKKTKSAFFAILHAAWACDDARDRKNAVRCRNLAVPLADRLLAEKGENTDNLKLMKTDILRRSGHFETLLAEYAGCKFNNDIMDKILAFQLKKAAQKDVKCYTVKQAVEG